MGRKALLVLTGVALLAFSSLVLSHCQIPCGIYDDQARFSMIAEEIRTIEKSMNEIVTLSAQDKPGYNQLVRWVQNKEQHADDLTHIVTFYFMAQRVTPFEKNDAEHYQGYVSQLTLLHQMIVYSTKAKQTVDLANVAKLRDLLAQFKNAYTQSQSHTH